MSLSSDRANYLFFLRLVATLNGCSPIWSDEYKTWCCGCEEGTHFSDQQCSIITHKSAKNRLDTKSVRR